MANRKVLIPLDRSDYSLKILPQVKKFIPVAETELILFHVAEPPHSAGKPASAWYETDVMIPEQVALRTTHQIPRPIYTGEVVEIRRAGLAEELRAKAGHLVQAGYKISVVIEFGDPADEILHAIEAKEVDLVAMTTHAREGLKRLLFGSVAEEVLHHVNVPILLIHPSERPERNK